MTDDLQQAVKSAIECIKMYELRMNEGQYQSARKWLLQAKGELEVAADE